MCFLLLSMAVVQHHGWRPSRRRCLFRTSRGNSRLRRPLTDYMPFLKIYSTCPLTAPCPYRQQRFGRLLKTLKSVDPANNADGGTPKSKATGKRAAPGKQNGTKLKNAKANTKFTEE